MPSPDCKNTLYKLLYTVPEKEAHAVLTHNVYGLTNKTSQQIQNLIC